MARLSRLPDELLCMIGDCCDHILDLHSLSATCRQFHHIYDPLLCKAAAKDYPHLLTWACDTSQLSLVKKLLAAGADPNRPCVAISPREQANYSKRVSGLRIVPRPRDLLTIVYNHNVPPRMEAWRSMLGQTANVVANDYEDNHYDDGRWDSDGSSNSSNSSNSTRYEDEIDGVLYYRTQADVVSRPWFEAMPYDKNPESWSRIAERHFWFPLHAATGAGSLEIVKLLVESGALLEPPSQRFCHCKPKKRSGDFRLDMGRWIPLHTALCTGNEAVACYLISCGSSSWLNDWHTSTALHQAAEMGHISVLQALYDQEPKINLNLADKSSAITMLYAHFSNRSTETISWLIEHGVDPNVRIGINGADMLQVACIFGRFQLAKAYIHAGARCDSKLKLTSEVAAFTPLERCCMTGHPSVLGVAASNIFGSRDTRNSSYFSAPDSEVDRASLVALMVEKGARIRGSRPGDGLFEPSPMVLAAQNHLVSIMEILIKTGTGVGVMDHLGMFPLCAPLHGDYAARQPPAHAQMSRTINWLLDHDADIEQKSSTHQVLYCLCNRPGYQTAEQISEQLELAQLLIDKGAVVDSMVIDPSLPESQQNSSALMAAFRRGRMSLCDLLIQSGAVFPSDADSLLHLLEGLLSNHKPFYQNEDFVPVDFSGEQEDCIDMFGPKWKEWSHPEKRTMLSGLRKKIFDGLDLLHSHDKHHMLAKHPRCLWIAAGVPGSPLVGKFLEAGALDASWVEEGRNCLDQLSQNPVSLVYHAEKFIALGAGPPGQSLLYHLIAGRKQFRNTKSWYLLQLFFSNGAKLDLCNRPTDYMGRQSPLALLTMNLSSVEDDYKGFELVLQSLSRPISETPDQGYGALLAACSHPIHPRPIKALIAAGVDVNYAPPGGSSVPSRLVVLLKDLLEYFAAGASEDDYERLYESIDEDGDEYEDCYDDEKIDFGQAGHMLDALKILIDNGAQFRESDPSLKGLYDILLDISKDEREVWSIIRDPDAQENAKEFIEGIRIEIEERVSWEGEKLLIVDRE